MPKKKALTLPGDNKQVSPTSWGEEPKGRLGIYDLRRLELFSQREKSFWIFSELLLLLFRVSEILAILGFVCAKVD
jgi:hypothetical protein